MFDPDQMRQRFWQLTREAEAVRAAAGPKRAARDAQVAEHEAALAALNAEIKALEAPLYQMEQERAFIARALGGQTGAPR